MLRPPRQLSQTFGSIANKLGWAAVIAAPFITHWALATGRHWQIAALFTVVQVFMIGAMVLRQAAGRRWLMALMAIPAALLIVRAAVSSLPAQPGLLAASALSHAGLYVSLLALFGVSLQAGHTPLITALARRLRGPLSPAVEAYTRGVTWLWFSYYAAQLVVSAALLLLAPVAIWSLFANVLDAPLLLLVFAVEYAVRLRRFPHEHHVSPMAIFRSFRSPVAPADVR